MDASYGQREIAGVRPCRTRSFSMSASAAATRTGLGSRPPSWSQDYGKVTAWFRSDRRHRKANTGSPRRLRRQAGFSGRAAPTTSWRICMRQPTASSTRRSRVWHSARRGGETRLPRRV